MKITQEAEKDLGKAQVSLVQKVIINTESLGSLLTWTHESWFKFVGLDKGSMP